MTRSNHTHTCPRCGGRTELATDPACFIDAAGTLATGYSALCLDPTCGWFSPWYRTVAAALATATRPTVRGGAHG